MNADTGDDNRKRIEFSQQSFTTEFYSARAWAFIENGMGSCWDETAVHYGDLLDGVFSLYESYCSGNSRCRRRVRQCTK